MAARRLIPAKTPITPAEAADLAFDLRKLALRPSLVTLFILGGTSTHREDGRALRVKHMRLPPSGPPVLTTMRPIGSAPKERRKSMPSRIDCLSTS